MNMKKIMFQFMSNGKTVKKTAILTDNLKELSNNKKNECYDLQTETWYDGYWSLFFEEEPHTMYEIEMEYDAENSQQTLVPIQAITWENNVITDVQKATVTTK